MKTKDLIYVLLSIIFLFISCKKEPSSSLEYDLELLNEVNIYRQSVGLQVLVHDDFLWKLANEHSLYQANMQGDANYDNRDIRYQKIKEEYGYGNVGENVTSGNGTAHEVVHLWLGSNTLKDQVQGDYTLSAISAVKGGNGVTYFTQLFYKR